jgi:hypothetical protein
VVLMQGDAQLSAGSTGRIVGFGADKKAIVKTPDQVSHRVPSYEDSCFQGELRLMITRRCLRYLDNSMWEIAETLP